MTSHPVPDAALEADIATVAQKGAGKSYANRGLVERLLDKGRRVIVLDPLNSWWGLKAMADGSAGYPIAVIGGPMADVPLDPTKGEQLARILAETDISAVVDVSDLTRSQLISFSTAFLSELYRVNRESLWLVMEEADVFAPQNPSTDGSRAMHDAADQIARRGRARGFRLWSITQRPARLSKDVLTQTSTLLLLRIRSPQDRKAAEEWIKGHAEAGRAAEIINSLASLGVGEGYVWAPDLDILERVRFPTNRTLDTSATPKAGERRATIKELAKPDLSALIEAMGPTVPTPTPIAATGVSAAEHFEAGRHAGFQAGLVEGERRGKAAGIAIGLSRARSALDTLRVPEIAAESDVAKTVPAAGESPGQDRVAATRSDSSASKAALEIALGNTRRPAPSDKAPNDAGALGTVEAVADRKALGASAKALDALAWWKTFGFPSIDRRRACLIAGFSPKASTFGVYIGTLAKMGLVDTSEPGKLSLTADGELLARVPEAVGDFPVVTAARGLLSEAETKVFDAVIAIHPSSIARHDLADKVELSRTASTLGVYLGKIASFGFIETGRGTVRAADWLFI